MKKLIPLLTKRFSVYVSGEFERTTDFLGLQRLLSNYSDFFEYTHKEQVRAVEKWLKDKEIYIDAGIFVRFK